MITVYVTVSEDIDVHQGGSQFALPAGVETVVWSCGVDGAERAASVLAVWARDPHTVSARIERS